ncbi:MULTISPECIES: UDP-glucose/GDP-mannose dehydrogenase family protein [unclassified Paenibacillus]|uniref:UDP-glucose dehydrogenase family protein n=1 Tax=unclassified Paenibacillus TaxID=185978 RepID=UPI0024059D63|nr:MULTISPECIES: UDP-glucose/GDP-mannose dehydrogenase family protein [unclassified Paenibacillus]MDF9842398.1 UDPglucose 6-dehydrogenase [Paenibacillus sp. PastF-2]MDF9848988.1 UDPglucose 6-dehydrogenase [Paenibacillus sp. PastM-2]MDF9855558.1 UDPglucose 6-dehydrogenase [Paenibacillus sp. PastF-1]MDH6480830.1 UDPglucose 6-dehydrogenase [Paenibacillus sp. PastH-2]MDH6508252.1 UDPglucose 6-dehydrogenase [Paenibacillus sp. PastM-3]
MKLAVIGTGYVGLVSGVCFTLNGNHVICVDKDEEKINKLNRMESPIYEPGIEALIEMNLREGRLSFSADLKESVRRSDIVILAVGTPSLPGGEADLQYIEGAAAEIADAMEGYKIIMTKSTVPVGTNERIRKLIASRTNHPFDIVSAPEFLREGSAIRDTLHPDRIVIGLDNPQLEPTMRQLHQGFTENIFVTDIRSAEMIKYASNAFLATKISFINEIANICEKVGADVTMVAEGMGMDRRIGSSFLQAGIGYGGSCFPKDTNALIQIAGNVDYEFKLLKSVVEVNKDQRFMIISKLHESLGSLRGAVIGIWGLAFKPNTDDVREAPAREIVEALVAEGATVKLYDPIAAANFRAQYDHPQLRWCGVPEEVAEGSDAVCLLTDWAQFKDIDLHHLSGTMRRQILIDGRNVYSKEQIEGTGLEYHSVGRPQMGGLSGYSPVAGAV